MKPLKKIQKKINARLNGWRALVATSKHGGTEYKQPGSRNQKKG